MSSGSKKKETRYAFSQLMNTLQVSNRAPKERDGVYKAFLHISQIPHKNLPT
jgi:hypothetical protein